MPAILPIILTLLPVLPKTTCRQLHSIVEAMLAMTGRVTQLGLSRWGQKGASYRTLQRFFHTQIDWLQVQALFFEQFVYQKDAVYLLAGDESPIAKAGKHTYGRDWFYSSILNKTMAGLSFFSIALINVQTRQAYSLSTEQIVRSEEEKEQAQRAKQHRKKRSHTREPKRPRGRPKGSKNKNKEEVRLGAELQRIFAQAQKVLARIKNKAGVGYFVLDGHFGNHCATAMVRQLELHLISKMHHNAELYLQPTQEEKAQHPRLKYGVRLDFAHLPDALRVSSTTEAGCRTDVYQAMCLHKRFAHLLNVVIVVKTDLKTQRVGHVVLFSSDLSLAAALLVDYYVLRFQIEFTFRDAKQYFGLEDFMVRHQTPVANAVGLAFFMVNLSRHLLTDLRADYPGAGINDLKSYYRARHYVVAFLKLVPETPEPIVCADLIEPLCRRLFIHPPQNRAEDLQQAA